MTMAILPFMPGVIFGITGIGFGGKITVFTGTTGLGTIGTFCRSTGFAGGKGDFTIAVLTGGVGLATGAGFGGVGIFRATIFSGTRGFDGTATGGLVSGAAGVCAGTGTFTKTGTLIGTGTLTGTITFLGLLKTIESPKNMMIRIKKELRALFLDSFFCRGLRFAIFKVSDRF